MSETAKRIVSGLSIAVVVILALYFYQFAAGLHAFFLIAAFALLGVEEFYRLTDKGLDGRPIRSIGFAFAFLFLVVLYLDYLTGLDASSLPDSVLSVLSVFEQVHNPIMPVLLLFLIVASSYSMVYRPLDGTAHTITSTIVGPIYAALPLGMVFSILSLDAGVFIFVYIAMAYVPGWIESVLLTVVLSFISVFGDLVESALKRDARIKDSSSTIPGHGGVLDLVDAMLFTFPFGFYYFYIRAMIV